jgi:starch synthase
MAGSSENPLKVLFLASEADPFYKVGGLGDYAGSLPVTLKKVSELEKQPLDIRVGLPFHQSIAVDQSRFTKIANLSVPKKKGTAKGTAFLYTHNDIPHYFIRRAGRAGGFSSVYSTSPLQDARKYIFFSLASLELARIMAWQPDVIHANDWHTAVTINQLSRLRKTQPFFANTRSLLVIHNLPYMGAGTEEVLNEFGIPPLVSSDLPGWSLHFPLVLGLAAADEIAAVSPSYAQELQEEEFGNGLKGFFQDNEYRTTGILNGIDTQLWNPQTDLHISNKYSLHDLDAKMVNKVTILKSAGLEHAEARPLLVAITRLDIQKGTDLLLAAMPQLLDLDWNLIVLGTGNQEYEKKLLDLQNSHPDRIRVFLEFNSILSHRLYAAGDIFLMPSRYEPCGLSQMIAMRYGCVPVARSVGGLRDTINDGAENERTGYLFQYAVVESFAAALRQAIQGFQTQPAEWRATQHRGMNTDFSWENSARKYLQLYRELK